MTKNELDTLLNSLGIPAKEGETADGTAFPRISYWEYNWTFENASGSAYASVVTYQISFFALTPRHPKLIALLQALSAHMPLPIVQHETVTSPTRMVHSFFAVEVLEDIL